LFCFVIYLIGTIFTDIVLIYFFIYLNLKKMLKKARIRKTDYQKGGQDNLAMYAENVVTKCTDKSFDPVRAFVTPVVEASTVYRKALTDAAGGGRVVVELKNVARENLLTKLDALATNLQSQPNATAAYLMNAGFDLVKERTSNADKVLNKPSIKAAMPTSQKGQLIIEVDKGNTTGVLQLGYEYTVDQGATWKNGTYSSRSRFLMTNLPSATEIMLRARALGTHEKVSDWSEVFVASVY
jgi:hypothetical protein